MARRGFWKPRRQHALLVTGASGFLGRHLARHPAIADWELIAPGSLTLDVRRREVVLASATEWKPQAIVHLAYRRDDPRTIVQGSRHVAEAAAACGAHLVHLSTDLVFGGRSTDYTESDRPDATLDYGRWKAEAEAAVLAACPSAVLLRTSLLYGTDQLSPPQLDVERAARAQTTMAFFTDEIRCPTHADDVAAAICQLADRREVSGPLHLASPEPMDRAAFARLVARWLGLDPAALRSATLAEAGVARPGRVVLDSSRAGALGFTCRPASSVLRA
jgi:dTDP-4-dehydrorhamnose reductase